MAKRTASILLDGALNESLERYMADTGLTFSQAVRLLLTTALRDEGVTLREAALTGGYREGLFLAMRRMKELSVGLFSDIEAGR